YVLTCASCSAFNTGFSLSAPGSPIHLSMAFDIPSALITPSAHSLVYFFSFIGHRIAKSVT
uniref:Uncharacterized protein n=1 Tax=Oryza brachyantha TaxID=4533 RepID=J3NAU0_ORYBR